MPNFINRRLLLIVGFLFLCVLLAALLYVMFFRSMPSAVTPTINNGIPGANLPTANTGQPSVIPSAGTGSLPAGPAGQGTGQLKTQKLINENARFSTLDPTTNGLLFYNAADGTFGKSDSSGNIQSLTNAKFPSVQSVTWAPDRSQAVLEFPDGANILYNFQSKHQVTLPQHWEDFSFNDTGKQLAFKSMGLDVDNRWLGIANPDGSGSEAIEPLGANADSVTVAWSPTGQVVGLQHKPSGADQQEIFFIGLQGENFRSLTVPGLGFVPSWTPDGQQLLYSVTSARSGYRPELWIVNASGEQIGTGRRSLSVNTWANKCTFSSNDRLYCAVPQSLPDGAGLTPDIAATIPDSIYEIDLKTGQKTLVGDPNVPITARSLYTSKDGSKLFIEDAQNGGIFTVAL
ncbi:MAG: hypothetical protein WC817_04945 [Patescibacteria group bacterium]|jgi:hypothetical protein